MKELEIKRELNEDTRRESVWYFMNGAVECFSLHVTRQGEVILTDHSDYTKIYKRRIAGLSPGAGEIQ